MKKDIYVCDIIDSVLCTIEEDKLKEILEVHKKSFKAECIDFSTNPTAEKVFVGNMVRGVQEYLTSAEYTKNLEKDMYSWLFDKTTLVEKSRQEIEALEKRISMLESELNLKG